MINLLILAGAILWLLFGGEMSLKTVMTLMALWIIAQPLMGLYNKVNKL